MKYRACVISLMLALIALFEGMVFHEGAMLNPVFRAILTPNDVVRGVLVVIFALQLGWFPVLSSTNADMSMAEQLYRLVLPILAPFLFVRNWAIALTGMLLWEAAEERERLRGRS